MNKPSPVAKRADVLGGFGCIAEHAAALARQHRRLILPAAARAESHPSGPDPRFTQTSFFFEDGSELVTSINFEGNRVDAYWSDDGCAEKAARPAAETEIPE